jgi:hypothetical protein
MQEKKLNELKKQKAEEFFSLSHRLLDVAKELSEYHAAELRMNIDHAQDLANSVARGNFKDVEELQKRAAIQAAQRMKVFQRKAKVLLKKMSNDSSEKAEKYLEKAHNSLLDWLDESDKKMPIGAEKLSKVVRDISSAGAKAFKVGRKLANDAADNLDELIDKTAGHEAPVKKAAPKKSATQKAEVGSAEAAPKTVPKE